MTYELLNFINLDPEEDIEMSLRLALMFKEEVDEATRAYMEMLHLTIDHSGQTPEEVNQVVREAISAALLTGIRAYRSWMVSQGVDVMSVEEESGKDIPLDFFHVKAKWPL